MKHDTLEHQPEPFEVGVYECEVHLKFRLIEERDVLESPERLLELLVEAFSFGTDEYMETLEATTAVQKVDELDASPQLRRQLIRLRNSKDMA